MPYPWARAVVVGASSGMGEAIARQLLQNGVSVALVARRTELLEKLAAEAIAAPDSCHAAVFTHDVRDTQQVTELFQRIAVELGGIDLVVYAAGIMPIVGPQQYPSEDDIATIETNLTGAVAWLNEAATRFSRAGEGTIIGISSVAGDRGRRLRPVYGATKAALDTYLESLRNRLAHRGVTVLTAKPGYVRTAMIEGTALPGPIPIISADDAASQILNAAAAGKRIVYIPSWWRYIMWVVRSIPAPLFERLNV